jgi:hypothetical protein
MRWTTGREVGWNGWLRPDGDIVVKIIMNASDPASIQMVYNVHARVKNPCEW